MGVYESCAKLKQAAEDMNIAWDRASGAWRDEKARQFQEEFVARFFVEVRKAQTALENIGPLLNRVHSELKE